MEQVEDGSSSPDVVKLTTLAVVAALRLASAVCPRFPLKENSLDWLGLLMFRLAANVSRMYVATM